MSPHKEKYPLTVKCTLCDFQVSQEVIAEPEDLVKEKTEMVKQAASIHKKHGDLNNFVVY